MRGNLEDLGEFCKGLGLMWMQLKVQRVHARQIDI